MRRWVVALLFLVAPASAFALNYDELAAMLADPAKPPADIVTAIRTSPGEWKPRDVYALIDSKAPRDVIAAVAAKAAVFYDGSQLSLDEISKQSREGISAQTVTIRTPDQMMEIFTFMEARKKERDAAALSITPPGAQLPGEPEVAFDKRKRQYEEDVARATAPFDGQIDATTFDIEFPAIIEPFDATNCSPKVSFEVTLDQIQYFTWKAGMGGTLLLHPVKLEPKSKSVTTLEFNANGTKRFYGSSMRLCAADAEMAKTFMAAGVKIQMKIHRTYKGQDWVGTAEFVNAKTNEKLPFKK